ncbi:MAG: NAD(P)/FAD-dependent oxidoreductase, partial [Candidatus Diapherotrites archaeon]|nr:NAD(P)/FAD-dependent oxidoreductase [Candidatus Diapherotrites archaeon]
GLFGWVIPRSKTRFEIGVGARLGTNLVTSFNKLLEKIGIEKKSVKNFESGLIPMGPPMETAVKNFSLLLGDAAYQTKATTGGGIITGSIAATEAAKCIGQHFTNGDKLTDYDNMWKKELQKDLTMHWKIRRYLDSLSDKQLDAIIMKANKSGLPDFLQKYGDMDRPSTFMPKLSRTVKFWRLFPDLVKFGLT